MPLILAASRSEERRSFGADRVVEGQRSVELAADDLAALGHLAQGRGVDGRRNLAGHGLDRREDRDLGVLLEGERQIDDVLDDVDLGIEVGKDVDRRIGDDRLPDGWVPLATGNRTKDSCES